MAIKSSLGPELRPERAAHSEVLQRISMCVYIDIYANLNHTYNQSISIYIYTYIYIYIFMCVCVCAVVLLLTRRSC